MKWNSVIVEQILHKFKKLPWWTFHLLLPGACSQLSFPLTWPQQLPYARLNTKRLKPKFLDHFSKRLAPNWSTKIENYFPQTNFSNYLGFPLPRPDSRSRAVEQPPWPVFIRRKMALLYSLAHQSCLMTCHSWTFLSETCESNQCYPITFRPIKVVLPFKFRIWV